MKNKFILLLAVIFIVRVFTVFFIDKTPCMELGYQLLGEKIQSGIKTEIHLSPAYSVMVNVITYITNDIKTTSHLIFIFFSMLLSFYLYKIAEALFNEKTALITLFISIFSPNLTVAIAGYSHSQLVGLSIEIVSLYYFILSLSGKAKHYTVIGILFAILSIAIRPEGILVLSLGYLSILALHTFKNKTQIRRYLLIGSSYIAFFFILVVSHKIMVQKLSSEGSHPGVFTDNRYAYITFLHTYSLREANQINEEIAIPVSTPLIGSPEANNYSIITAIKNNPKEFLRNVLYNIKELLDYFAVPLFLPFYFYIFLGAILLIPNNLQENFSSFMILLIMLFAHTIPLLIFHIEVRYLQGLLVLLLIMIAYGLSLLPKKQMYYALALSTAVTIVIYFSYLFQNRNLSSLCG